MLATIGVHLVTAESPERYPTVELDDVAALDPSLVLVPSEPYTFTDDHVDRLAEQFPRAALRRIDGQDLFWWGVRTPGAIERLRSVSSTR